MILPDADPSDNPVKLWKYSFGTKPVQIHGSVFTIKNTDIIVDRLAEIRGRYSAYAKTPALENEAPEKYIERANKHVELQRLMRKEGENIEDWTKKQYTANRNNPRILLDLLNVVLELAGQPQLEYADIENAVWVTAKEFVFEMLWVGAGLYIDELVSPKS